MQRTLIILKPDAVERRLVGEIVGRFERKGLKIVALKFSRLPRAVVEEHYAEHRERDFFPGLVQFMTAGPVVLLVVEGNEAIEVARRLIGSTRAHEANAGTIRGDLGMSGQFNLVHGSDSPESAARELALFFRPEEIEEYALPDEGWLR